MREEFDKQKVEEFDNDILKTNQEYLDMINEMQNLYGEGEKSNEVLDQMIERLILGLNRRVTVEQKCEGSYLKRQFKEWKAWQRWLKAHKEPAQVEDAPPEPPPEPQKEPQEQPKALPPAKPKHSLLLALKTMFKRIGDRPAQAQLQAALGDVSPSQAPPEAESPKPEAQEEQSEAIEGDVLEEDEEEQDDSNSSDDEVEDELDDDGVMQF